MPITKQTIAVIGSGGPMGSTLAKGIADGNYRLLLFDEKRENSKLLKEKIQRQYPTADVKSMDCAHGCSWEADVIIIAAPHEDEEEIAQKIQDVATQKIVISITDPRDQELSKLAVKQPLSMVEGLQHLLPNSKIVKAVKACSGIDVEQPVIGSMRENIIIAGDDEKAVHEASELIEKAGFDVIIAEDYGINSTRKVFRCSDN